MRSWYPLVFGCVFGCRLNFDPSSGASDAGSESGDLDGGVRVCTNWGGWSAPMLAPELNTAADEYGGSLSADGKLICFSSIRSGGVGGLDVWCATRSTTDVPFDPPQDETAINQSQNESDVEVSPDGLEVYFAANRAGGLGGKDIYVATRSSRSVPFGSTTHLAMISSAMDEEPTEMSNDGHELYFTLLTGTVGTDVYVATRSAIGQPFGTPVVVPAVNSANNEEGMALTDDGLEVILGSNRPGGSGGRDPYSARRASRSDPFGPLTRHPELSTNIDDMPAGLTPDGATMYFNYMMSLSGTPQSDIWTTTRTCLDP